MVSLSIFPAPEFGKFEFAGARGHLCRGRSRQPVGEFDLCLECGPGRAEFRERRAQHGGADRASRRAVQPVVIAALRLQFPFVDPPAAPLGLHPVFGGQVFGEQLMDAWNSAVEREAPLVAERDREPGVNKTFPIIDVLLVYIGFGIV